MTTEAEWRTCPDCHLQWHLRAVEREFFETRGLQLPRRCRACRQERRKAREAAETGAA